MELQASAVGERLTSALLDLFSALPEAPARSAPLTKTLGINKDLASKVLLATGKPDPLAAISVMPGPEALTTLVQAAAKRKINPRIIDSAQTAIREFEQFIRTVAGGRAELLALLSGWLPEARTRLELESKQLAYRAMSNLKGATATLGLDAILLHPTADGQHADTLCIMGTIGLRRLRPDAVAHFSYGTIGPEPDGYTITTLEGTSIDVLGANTLLPDFCTQPLPALEICHAGNVVHYHLAGNAVGPQSAVNLFLAQVARPGLDLYSDPARPRRKALSAEVEVSMRALVFDVLLHEAVWPNCTPELATYDTTINGAVDINDPASQFQRLSLIESVQLLGHGLAKCRIAEAPNYVDLLRHACARLGWNGDEFRCFRCCIAYPLYGSQVSLAFTPPAPLGAVR